MKKLLSVGLVAMSILALSACSGKKSAEAVKVDESELKPYGKYEKPVTFTIGRSQRNLQYMPEGDTIKDNAAVRFLEKETNIVPEVAWETADYDQKLALSISTGDIPDVVVVGYDQYNELMSNGLLEDLTEVYDKAASDEVKARIDSYDNVMDEVKDEDGKIRAIPMPAYYYEHTVTWIREDWLKKVGAEVPETIDELHDLAKKNGENPKRNWYPEINTGFYYLKDEEYYMYSEPVTKTYTNSEIPIIKNIIQENEGVRLKVYYYMYKMADGVRLI